MEFDKLVRILKNVCRIKGGKKRILFSLAFAMLVISRA